MVTRARTLRFSVVGPIAREDLPGLTRRVCSLFSSAPIEAALCDVRGVEPNAVTVEALARLQLAAQRYGCRVWLVHASKDLLDLVAFMGLRDVLAEEIRPRRRDAEGGRRAGTAARLRGRT